MWFVDDVGNIVTFLCGMALNFLYWDILSLQYLKSVFQNTICGIYGVFKLHPADYLKTETIRVFMFLFWFLLVHHV